MSPFAIRGIVRASRYLGNRAPVRSALEALFAGASMQCEQLCTGLFQLLAPMHGIGITATPTQACLHRDGHRHGICHRFHDLDGELWITDQAGTTPFAGNLAHRAAHVDVDQKGPTGFSPSCCISHGLGAMVEQLHADGPGFLGERLHLAEPMPHLEAGGIHHFGEQQRVGRPAPHQTAKDPIAHPCQRRLQHAAAQLTRGSIAGKLQRG